MADVICRWRNGTPETVQELVKSLPHIKMSNEDFRKFMAHKWHGDFFTTPYQLACQLGLYCEAEDGFYYPRFDRNISLEEAEQYLVFWLPRYYVPNPYVGKDGFKDINCPTYVFKSIYDYVKKHPGTDYKTAYQAIFKEDAKNNNDIMRNYINNYSKVLSMSKEGVLTTTDYNPDNIFGFMNRNDRKGFFDSFNSKKEHLIDKYLHADIEFKKQLFRLYLTKYTDLEASSVNHYVVCQSEPSVLSLIFNTSGQKSLYNVIDISKIEMIYEGCLKLDVNKKHNYVYSSSVKRYKEFINFLESEEADDLLDSSDITIHESTPEPNPDGNTGLESIPFSISKVISLIKETGLIYDDTLIKRFAFSLMSKRFLILSGLAGSGKTQLALAFASALIESDKQMCVVSVGADWTNREPLLGFPNALNKDEYVKPECGALDLLIQAEKDKERPYFLILDEMNMSYVERYFADFLSAMESHKPIALWEGNDEIPARVSLPNNLFIIGTINVDETTYMFSPKVLDRANVIEFKISSDEMSNFLNEMKPIDRDSINYKAAGMGASFVSLANANDVAGAGDESKKILCEFFNNLKEVNAEFGYRSATEIYRFIKQAELNDDTDKKLSPVEILDCAIVQKLLPKLHGSRKKLEPVLEALWKECFKDEENKAIQNIIKENVGKADYKLTADKIQRMYDAAYTNGFTSFAEA